MPAVGLMVGTSPHGQSPAEVRAIFLEGNGVSKRQNDWIRVKCSIWGRQTDPMLPAVGAKGCEKQRRGITMKQVVVGGRSCLSQKVREGSCIQDCHLLPPGAQRTRCELTIQQSHVEHLVFTRLVQCVKIIIVHRQSLPWRSP